MPPEPVATPTLDDLLATTEESFEPNQEAVSAPPAKPMVVPATPRPSAPALSDAAYALAEAHGISREEAEALGGDRQVMQMASLLSRRQRHAGQQPSPVSAQPPVAAPLPLQEEAIDYADPDEFERAGYDPNFKKMAASIKKLEAKMQKQVDAKIKELEARYGDLPDIRDEITTQRAERGERVVKEITAELGIDINILKTQEMAERIGRRVAALRQIAQSEGQNPDTRDLLRQAITMVVGPGRQQPQAPPLAQVAIEEPQRRRFNGQPTNRITAPEQARATSQTRDFLLDKGVDPGVEIDAKAEAKVIKEMLLPG